MRSVECSICNNPFNVDSHRPRALPCGHGYCTPCIEACIRRGYKTCPDCRMVHGANSATDLPVNFLFEEWLNNVARLTSEKHKNELDIEIVSGEMSPKHKGSLLYFHCKSHDVNVCHSCTVIDHPSKSCNLIDLDDEMEQTKQLQIVTVQKQKQVLMDTANNLKTLLQKDIDCLTERTNQKQDLEKEAKLLQNKIEQIQQRMVTHEKCQHNIKGIIQCTLEKHKSFEILENKLRLATSIQDIAEQCKEAKYEILESQKVEVMMEKKFNLKKMSEAYDKYDEAESKGHPHSCNVSGSRRTLEVSPPSSGSYIQEVDLTASPPSSGSDIQERHHSCNVSRSRTLQVSPPSSGSYIQEVDLTASQASRRMLEVNPPSSGSYIQEVDRSQTASQASTSREHLNFSPTITNDAEPDYYENNIVPMCKHPRYSLDETNRRTLNYIRSRLEEQTYIIYAENELEVVSGIQKISVQELLTLYDVSNSEISATRRQDIIALLSRAFNLDRYMIINANILTDK